MRSFACVLAVALVLVGGLARADVGLSSIAGTDTDGPITLYYPTKVAAAPIRRGPFTLQLAEQAPPERGNGRLVVISHGSGGGPWVHADLARSLVEAGF